MILKILALTAIISLILCRVPITSSFKLTRQVDMRVFDVAFMLNPRIELEQLLFNKAPLVLRKEGEIVYVTHEQRIAARSDYIDLRLASKTREVTLTVRKNIYGGYIVESFDGLEEVPITDDLYPLK